MPKKPQKMSPFGLHLMIDAYNCNQTALADFDKVYGMLEKLPEKIGMRKMTLPYVVRWEGNGKKDPGGWTGFVLIAESHISVHTFVKRGFVTIDIYSCKDFDPQVAIAFLKDLFKMKDMEVMTQSRGKRYPEENIEE